MMKKFLIIIAITIAVQVVLNAQPCLPEGITFTTQEEIDNFQTNYPGCNEIRGDVKIQGNSITNLNGLSILTSVDGDLMFWNNGALTTLSGLENLTSVGGILWIEENDTLNSLSGLENLSSIGTKILIRYNKNLVTLSGLNNLFYAEGSIVLWENINLTSLLGLDNLDSIGGYLEIYNSDSLTLLSGLENLVSIGGFLEINDNDGLTSLSGLENLASIGLNFWLADNESLTTLSDLENLSSIGGTLMITGNNVLTSLSGLEKINSIGGIFIQSNDSLTSLSGLENLNSDQGDLRLAYNNSLISISELENIEANSIQDLYIFNNLSLSNCNVESVCEYLVSPNGEVQIYNNAPGCNSEEEVEEACTVSVSETRSGENVKVYPNPFTTSTTIEYELNKPSEVTISIYNHFGELVKVIRKKQSAGKQQVIWNADGLPAGIYYFRMEAGEQISTKKLLLVR